MTAEVLSDAADRARRRRESVATAERVFAALLEEVEAGRVRRTAALRPGGTGPAATPGEPAAAPGGLGAVDLVGRPGSSVRTSMWVHNVGTVGVPAIALELTALRSGDGAEIAAAHGTLLPGRVRVGPRESAEVHVTLAVPGDAAPGVYRGHLRGEGLPAALPVRLVVDP